MTAIIYSMLVYTAKPYNDDRGTFVQGKSYFFT